MKEKLKTAFVTAYTWCTKNVFNPILAMIFVVAISFVVGIASYGCRVLFMAGWNLLQ